MTNNPQEYDVRLFSGKSGKVQKVSSTEMEADAPTIFFWPEHCHPLNLNVFEIKVR